MAILEPFVLSSPETSLTNFPVAGKSTAPRPKKTSPAQEIASTHSIFEIDQEIDAMIEAHQQEFEANGLISAESMLRFEQFLHAMNAKVDRIGGYILATENIANCSKLEADRLSKRARTATNKADRVKSMLLYYMKTREQQSLEGTLFTARICKNAADTVTVTDKDAIPAAYRRHDARIDGGAWESILALLPRELQIVLESSAKDFSVNSEAIKAAKTQGTEVPGVEVKRGDHLRIG
ncbi:MAG: siphovirus Gp157 family protein [Acidobacteriaceae bacterium]